MPSELTLALKENCLRTVLPSVFWSKIVPWPDADGLRAAADVDRRTNVVAARAVINNPAKRNFLLRLILSTYDLHGPSVRTGEGSDQRGNDHTHPHTVAVRSTRTATIVRFLVRIAGTI